VKTQTFSFTSGVTELTLPPVSSGLYVLHIRTFQGIVTRKIIVGYDVQMFQTPYLNKKPELPMKIHQSSGWHPCQNRFRTGFWGIWRESVGYLESSDKNGDWDLYP